MVAFLTDTCYDKLNTLFYNQLLMIIYKMIEPDINCNSLIK